MRDAEGAEGGASWNELRNRFTFEVQILFSEVQRSTGAKRTLEQARRHYGKACGKENAGTPKIVKKINFIAKNSEIKTSF